VVELVDAEEQSDLRGARKHLMLADDGDTLAVSYQLPDSCSELTIETCLSPHYYRLLRHGRRGLRRDNGEGWRGARNGEVAVWVASDDDGITWADELGEVGHGLTVRMHARTRSFHLVVGVGAVDAARCRSVLAEARSLLDRVTPQPVLVGRR
jgi:hypothetical protein